MLDQEGYEWYVRKKIELENKLEESGDINGSEEIKLQMNNVEVRLLAQIKQAHNHAQQEMSALRFILIYFK